MRKQHLVYPFYRVTQAFQGWEVASRPIFLTWSAPCVERNTPKKQPQIPRRRDAHCVWSSIDNFLFL